ncbi:Pectinesterase inhibitor domain [Sesbania bispinosa]|nr:Pectinesterase inhibitor domain [Sesbania bispinosa]
MAHSFKDTSPNIETKSTSFEAHPPEEGSQFSDPKNSFSHPPSEAPQNPTSEGGSGHSKSFSAAFSDILKGSLRGHTLTMPQNIKTENKQIKDEVEKICAHTDYPDVCISTIPPLLNVNKKFDVIDVLEAAIKACTQQIKLTISKFEKHSFKSSEIAAALTDCRELYFNALGNLQRALDACPSRDFGTVTVMLSAVMADVSTCESGFEDLKSPSSITSENDGFVSITVSNCLSIAALIPY